MTVNTWRSSKDKAKTFAPKRSGNKANMRKSIFRSWALCNGAEHKTREGAYFYWIENMRGREKKTLMNAWK
jgi:hypothetical protein